ncbi:MAG: FKBP-type peptidyl-prolyl cis-trans isomerase [Sphingomonadaceae bacterium]
MSVTAVPLQPTPKGTLTKLFVGVGLAVLAAGGLAWVGTANAVGAQCGANAFAAVKGKTLAPVTTATGLMYQIITPGSGPTPTDADVALVNYKGRLTNGKEFDANQKTPFPVTGVIPGFTEGLKIMQRGGSYRLCIPAALGYGAVANERIPANSTLIFDVDLLDFRSMAEIQAMQQQLQQQGGVPPQGIPGGR